MRRVKSAPAVTPTCAYTFRTQISRCLHEVVIKTKREYWKAPEFRRGNDLPFSFVGVGANGHVHGRTAKRDWGVDE